MFISYDCTTFGNKIRQIRQNLKFSQQAVYDATSINTDTLRRIEHGLVVPKFETLELLSRLYKTNLLLVLDSCKRSNLLLTFYNDLDEVILNGSKVQLQSIKDQLKALTESDPLGLDHVEVTHFSNFVHAIDLSVGGKKEAIGLLCDLLIQKHEDFSVDDLSASYFDPYDCKVLLVLGVSFAEAGQIDTSNRVLEFLLNYQHDKQFDKVVELKMHAKTLINLSYNMHLIDNHEAAFDYAYMGAQYCTSQGILYGLHLFYYRMGIARFHMGLSYDSLLNQCMSLMDLQGLTDLKAHYEDILTKTYNIKIGAG